MYCIHCGSQVEANNRFCFNCGKPVGDSPTSNQENGNSPFSEVHQTHEDNLEKERQLLMSFIGHEKAHFYLSKWNKQSKVSWNWPAFLFSWFWLGYRKLYAHLFILLGVFLIIDLISYVLGSESNAIGISVGLLYGLFGNYFYRIHVEKKLKNIKRKYSTDKEIQAEALRQGGASGLGLLASFGILFLYVMISMMMYMGLNNLKHTEVATDTTDPTDFSIFEEDSIIFGTGSDDSGVTGVTDVFSEGDLIYLEADFGGPINSSEYTVYILKETTTEELFTSWKEEIDPTWPGIFTNLYDPQLDDYYLDAGNYIIRLFDSDDKLVSEGRFTVK